MQQGNLGIEPEVLKAIYGQMARIRAVDKAVQAGLSSGKFMFTYWPMTGQECIPATISQLTTSRDYMITTYRGIHDQVAKGVDLYGMFAEALGREDGVNKGKGGSPHISDPSSGSMVTTAIVGAGAPIANGLAIAAKERGEDRVTIVNFGDGATSIGAVHEAMNLAGAWKLPVIFMCQNNTWGEYTRIPTYTASPNFFGRAEALGFKGVQLDGNDPAAFYKGMKEVIDYVREGKGPVFVEAMTYRLGPHAGVGDNYNATKDELAAGKERAPYEKTRALLLEAGISSEDELTALEAAAKAEVDDAIARALESKVTPATETLVDVFADVDSVPKRSHYPVREAEGEFSGPTETMTMAQAIQSAQKAAMTQNPEVFLLGEDVGDPHGGAFGTNKGLEEEFGDRRVRATPIAEQAIIGAAVGSSIAGMNPIAEIMFSDFMGVCLDQIANHAAKQRYMSGSATHAPMTIRMQLGGGMGGFGAQHSQSLEAWLTHTPGIKVAFPSNPVDAKGLLLSAINDPDPVVILESIMLLFTQKDQVPIGDYRIPLGVAKVKREGTDVTLITYGWQVGQCLAAAEELAKEGINAEVIDLRSLVPIDYHRILQSVKKTGRAVVVHAAVEFCGMGAEICSTINEELWDKLKGPAVRLGAEYAPIAYSKIIETNQVPHAASIAARVRAVVK
ncbi:dehydrogenase E1 component subunit alpha/beta [Novosphingobium sp. G106]|uniref:alpha-ketoacid dehydrogenase subunit alpha/beta n=1 Tax=Novosphingobium sp. G106 TaxID=2849500 RepID=UPI001C2D6A2A|nr:dehydrogenase E1 component subunit alpha/beta [Novosphingobium sp. G106]MBV1687858.1 dehydrogenase E1 component subunit alpha/beta [Novosphingobium sp. G106]